MINEALNIAKPITVTVKKRKPLKHDITYYIPKKLLPYFDGYEHESNGYWIYFTDNVTFASTETSMVHESTIRECREAMRDYVIG